MKLRKTTSCLHGIRRLAAFLAIAALSSTGFAASSTWTGADSSLWTEAGNWDPGVPNGSGDAALFGLSGHDAVTVDQLITVSDITFSVGAESYTLSNSGGLIFDGAGIVNNSGTTQTFNNTTGGGMQFFNSASAGNAVINNTGSSVSLQFLGNSTAGTATITNNSGNFLDFSEGATAGSATIANSGAMTFSNTSSAGQAHITASGGSINLYDAASLGTATIDAGADLTFHDNSSAAGATINIAAATTVFFSDLSSSGSSTITSSGLLLYASGTAAVDTSVTLNSGGKLSLANFSSSDFTIKSLNSNAGSEIVLGSNNLVIGTADVSNTFSSTVSGTSGSITKVGTGTLALSGTSNYGALRLNAGAIAASGSTHLASTATPSLQIGGTSSFTLSNRGRISADGDVLVDPLATSTILVSGSSALITSGTMRVSGQTSMQVTTGGTITAASTVVGSQGGNVNLLVTGSRTIWNNSNHLDLANGGTASLTISAGAQMNSADITVAGGSVTDSGTVTITGTGSVLAANSNGFRVGTSGTGVVLISNGGTFNGNFSGTSIIGGANEVGGAYGSVTVTGTRSTYTSGTVSIGGKNSTGTLRIDNGGFFQTTGLNLTDAATGTTGGTATVIQTGGTVNMAGAMRFGSGTATYSLQGGLITLQGSISSTNNGSSTFEFAGGTMTTVNVTSTIAVPISLRVSTTTTINNTAGSTITGLMSGSGVLAKTGNNSLTITGSNTYSGGTRLGTGTLITTTNGALGTGAITFTGAGSLQTSSNVTSLTNDINVLAGGTSTITALGNINLSGVISGAGSFAMNGFSGLVTLSGSNSYTGNTVVSSGTVQLANVNAISNSSLLVLNGGDIAGTSGIVSTINKAVTLSGFSGVSGTTDLTFTNTLTNSGGAFGITFSNTGSTTFSGPVNLSNNNNTARNVSFILDSAPVLISGTIANGGTGAGSITKDGDGTLFLSAANSYTGTTFIVGGILSTSLLANGGVSSGIGASGTAASTLVITDGTLQYTGTGAITNRLFQIGTSANGSGATLDASGVASGTSDGSLIFSNTAALAYGTNNRSRTLTLTGTNTGNNTLRSRIANNGTGVVALVKNGSGKWILTGSNSYSGDTHINEGTLSITNRFALGAGLTTSVSDGATLDLNNVAVTGENIRIAGSGVGGNGALTATGSSSSSGDLILEQAASIGGPGSLNLSGIVTGGNLLTKVGSGTLIFSGNIDNYALSAVVDGGTLILAKDSSPDVHALGDGLVVNSGGTVQLAGTGSDQINDAEDVTINTGGVLDLNGRSDGFVTLLGSGLVTNTAAATVSTLTLGANDQSSTFSGTLQDGAGVLALSKVNGSTLVLTGSNHFSGGTTILGGTLDIGGGGATGSISGDIALDGGLLKFNRSNDLSFSGAISGSGLFEKAGAGKLTLTGSTSFEGDITISAGTLALSGDATLGASYLTAYLTNGATLELDSAHLTKLMFASGSGADGNGAITSTGTSVYEGEIYLDSGISLNVINGTLSLQAGVYNNGLTKLGAGNLVLSGTLNNDSLAVEVDTGTLVLAKDSTEDIHAVGNWLLVHDGAIAQLGGTGGDQIYDGATVGVEVGGTFDLNGRNEGISGLGGDGLVTNAAATTTSILTVGTFDRDSEFDGTLQDGAGTLALTKVGGGTFTVSGSNSYSGGTRIQNGTLVAGHNFAVGTGSVVVEGGVFFIVAGVTVSNTVTLSGGGYYREIWTGSDLTNAINATSHFAVGGRADTSANILSGTASADTTLQSSFSTTSTALNDSARLSDIYTLGGVPVVDEDTGETDIFVLQLSLTSTASGTYLAWLDTNTNTWVNAIDGNFNNNPAFSNAPFLGSFAAFQSIYGTDLSAYLGAYGIDNSGGVIANWAVLNHNSDFAVIPEPQTWLLAGLGLSLLLVFHRRSRTLSPV